MYVGFRIACCGQPPTTAIPWGSPSNHLPHHQCNLTELKKSGWEKPS